MSDQLSDPPSTANAEQSQQARTITQLLVDGWVVVEPQPPATDGSILLQLVTPQGVSHIVVMLNGDCVDERQTGKANA